MVPAERRDLCCILELEPEFREVLILRDVEDLSYDELCQVTGLADGTVKSRLSRGTEAVRSALVRRQHPLALAASTPATHPIGDPS